LRVHRFAAAIDMTIAIAANATPANQSGNWASNSSGMTVLPSVFGPTSWPVVVVSVSPVGSGLTPAAIATKPSMASRPRTNEYAGSAAMLRLMVLRSRAASTAVMECG
jgi:hypothetical protein